MQTPSMQNNVSRKGVNMYILILIFMLPFMLLGYLYHIALVGFIAGKVSCEIHLRNENKN